MELTAAQQAGLVRIFGDEDLMDAISGVCKKTASEYKERASLEAVKVDPNLANIVRLANRGFAFDELMNVMALEYEELTKEGQDG